MQSEHDTHEQKRTESEHALQVLKNEFKSKTARFSILLQKERLQNTKLNNELQALKHHINQNNAMFLAKLKTWPEQIETLRQLHCAQRKIIQNAY